RPENCRAPAAVGRPLRALRSALPTGRPSSEGRLEARGIRVHFAGVKAVDGVDIHLEQSEILGLIGPNGAGKTTLVNAISGFQSLTEGSFSVGGRDVSGWHPHKLAKIGLTRTFQNVRPFSGLTVLDNVELGGVG